MISDINTSEHYTWGDNCDSWILCDDKSLNVKYEKMPPKTSEQLHFHQKTQQFFFILKGEASFSINNEFATVKPQQGFRVTADTKHQIANNGDSDLEFLVISQPAVGNDRINL